MTIFGAILFASVIMTSCGPKEEEISQQEKDTPKANAKALVDCKCMAKTLEDDKRAKKKEECNKLRKEYLEKYRDIASDDSKSFFAEEKRLSADCK